MKEKIGMSKMKNKYFDIIDKVEEGKRERAYELQNLIEFTEWNIQSDKSDLANYVKEYNELLGDKYV